jgi:hypothetical protein
LFLPFSSLALFVLGIFANDPHHALALDNLALAANLFYGCLDFHNYLDAGQEIRMGTRTPEPLNP